jgi:hypothetical protein
MKIRIKGNFVRYRLTKPEVEALAETGRVAEETCFGPQTLIYALETREGAGGLEATFDGQTITLFMPAGEARDWAGNDRVGFESDMTVGDGKILKLLLEKDFVCLDTAAEDQSDNYPNPRLE